MPERPPFHPFLIFKTENGERSRRQGRTNGWKRIGRNYAAGLAASVGDAFDHQETIFVDEFGGGGHARGEGIVGEVFMK